MNVLSCSLLIWLREGSSIFLLFWGTIADVCCADWTSRVSRMSSTTKCLARSKSTSIESDEQLVPDAKDGSSSPLLLLTPTDERDAEL